MNLKGTELTLGLPGDQSTRGLLMKSGMKSGYLDMVDLKLGSSSTTSEVTDNCLHHENSLEVDKSETEDSDTSKPPRAKVEQVVGWPPMRAYGKNTMKSCKYVKVMVDGAPYLRKVDLEVYNSYEQLLGALEELFMTSFTILNNVLNERKLMDPVVNGMECVPTYEDKDDDWMLVGDFLGKCLLRHAKGTVDEKFRGNWGSPSEMLKFKLLKKPIFTRVEFPPPPSK